ncbi:MAG: NTP transferase domain-containing protein [Halioglobus sp.]
MALADVTKIAAIVLAAGSSRRMGEQHKLLVDFNGMSMVSRVVDAVLRSSVCSATVVIGHRGNEIRTALGARDVAIVDNPDYGSGLSSSLKVGLSSLPEEIQGAIIILADMPFVGVDLLEKLIDTFACAREQNIVVPVKSGRMGNPVIWPARLFPEMMKLQGDKGARKLLDEFADQVTTVPVLDDAAFFDIDTPAELEKANDRVELALRDSTNQQRFD